MSTAKLEGHRLANYFPSMGEDEFNELVKGIKENGQLNPIMLYEGKILDGKHRFKACQKLGIEPITKEYKGNDPISFVISANIHRRHLTESQRAMLATKMLPELEKQAKARSLANLKQNRNKTDPPRESLDSFGKNKRSKDKAGEMFGVSGSTVQRAKRIIEAVENGEIEKEVIDRIIEGKETVNGADNTIATKRFVAREKARIEKEIKQLPNQYPKAVKEFIDATKEYRDKVQLATILKKEGMFSPEATQFTNRLLKKLIADIEEMEGTEK
jgi:ParB-like chromosome segregation protein Spo0J